MREVFSRKGWWGSTGKPFAKKAAPFHKSQQSATRTDSLQDQNTSPTDSLVLTFSESDVLPMPGAVECLRKREISTHGLE